jgi:Spy/CpxP family protein refolding chaperone
MLRELGLSREQIEQIRQVNLERKPLMDEAQRRSRAANRALDEAIYADQLNEAEVEVRLKEAQLAQGELARIRYMNELSVRRILTPEQLTRFRELRRRFDEVRKGFKNRGALGGDAPFRRRMHRDDSKAAPGGQRPQQRQNGGDASRPEM